MRYLPLTDQDRKHMLSKIGVDGIDALFSDIPEQLQLSNIDTLPNHASEMAVERHLSALANKNTAASSVPFFVGAGAYKHHVPATVDHIIQRSEFLTSYTPYQAEMSQGTLQALFEFQTQVSLLTGMEVANASMYDGSTGCAEAVLMAHRVTKRKKAILSGGLHPHYRDVTQTMSDFADYEVYAHTPDPENVESLADFIDDETSCVVVQYPNFYGHINDFSGLAEKVHASGALLIVVVTEIVSLGAVKSPGDMGADIVVGEGQSIGNSLNFGGPYVGLFATRQKFVRQMPGRVCGETVDSDGKRGFVLTLSTREQHIKREKATSNICTNSGLCCLAFTVHLSLLGELGFSKLAQVNHANAVCLAEQIEQLPNVEILTSSFFNEFTVRLPVKASEVVETLAEKNILAGVPVSRLEPASPELENLLLVASTEMNTDKDRETFITALKEVLPS
ncbi:MAG: aminomethyl-transferring glycine dehydrogenase subunit GcvPA [Pseudomonadota bacterium]